MNRAVDYDWIADEYDRRYDENDYGGVERTLLDFVGDSRLSSVLEVGCGTGHWLAALAMRSTTFTARPLFRRSPPRPAPEGRLHDTGSRPHTGRDHWWIYEYFGQVCEIDKPVTGPLRKSGRP